MSCQRFVATPGTYGGGWPRFDDAFSKMGCVSTSMRPEIYLVEYTIHGQLTVRRRVYGAGGSGVNDDVVARVPVEKSGGTQRH